MFSSGSNIKLFAAAFLFFLDSSLRSLGIPPEGAQYEWPSSNPASPSALRKNTSCFAAAALPQSASNAASSVCRSGPIPLPSCSLALSFHLSLRFRSVIIFVRIRMYGMEKEREKGKSEPRGWILSPSLPDCKNKKNQAVQMRWHPGREAAGCMVVGDVGVILFCLRLICKIRGLYLS